ncbi:MAG TPA: zinc ribbon domain-containing protein [Gemmatimonadales bacterium]|nr:zinc ribbon domain-containing protein [Gemmatimonadales bacterium]
MSPELQKCPSCGAETSGKFCSECGAPLAPSACRSCGAKLSARAKFCPECGTPVAGAARGARSAAGGTPRNDRMAWYVAGVCVLALLVVVVIVVAKKSGAPPAGAAATAAGAPPTGERATTDLSAMTPREAADRLYNRIMTANEAGDTAQVNFFAPMALQAYANLGGDLDADARLHLGLVQLAIGATVAAAAEGDTILQKTPSHLFGWLLKARAAEAQGDAARAKRAYESFMKNYDAEMAKKRPEYQEHAQMLQDTRNRAQRAGAGGA